MSRRDTAEDFQEEALALAKVYNVIVTRTMTFGQLAEIIRTQPQSRPGTKVERDWSDAFTKEELANFEWFWNRILISDLSKE